jgi:hypothetical protein
MSDNPLEILEEMSKVGNKEKEIKITDDFSVTVRPLSGPEEEKVHESAEKLNGTQYFDKVIVETLVLAIVAANKKSLKTYETIENLEEKEKVKKETYEKIRLILAKWNDDLKSYVYGEYNKLLDEIKSDLIKLGIIKEDETETKEENKTEEVKQNS